MKAADWIGVAWVITTLTFWVAAGIAAAGGDVGAAFAYAIFPVLLVPIAGLAMRDAEPRPGTGVRDGSDEGSGGDD